MENNQPELNNEGAKSSPPWSNNVKIIIALVLLAITAALLFKFKYLVPPIFIALMLAFLLYPAANWLKAKLRIPWGFSAALVVLALALIGGAILAIGGIAIFEQSLSLIKFLEQKLLELPKAIDTLAARPLYIWNFKLDISTLTLDKMATELQKYVGPIFNRSANIIGVLLKGAATSFGSVFLVLMITYFVLADSKGAKLRVGNATIPGYEYDFKRMGKELATIWNSFLRGQLLIVLLTIVLYTILLMVLRVNYFLGLAILAGLARFIPYVGPAIAWATYAFVTLSQGTTMFGLTPVSYTVLVLAVAIIVDFILDNAVTPKIMGGTLSVHPAAIMIAALVFASLFGVIGVMLAAPVLATFQLLFTYVLRKLFDQDPWSELDKRATTQSYFGWRTVRRWFIRLGCRIKNWINGLKSNSSTKSTGG